MLTTSASSQTVPTQSERFHALDAVRAFALIIGIFFHGIMSFASYVQPINWGVRDSQTSVFLDGLFYVSHSFRMQAFFLIAGYFAHLLYHRRGVNSFLQNRSKRILLPFLLFWPVLYVLFGVLWTWGHQNMGLVDPKTLSTANQSPWQVIYEDVVNLKWLSINVPITHLWFLYFLVFFCGGVLLIRPIVARLDRSGQLRARVDSSIKYIVAKWWGGLLMSVLILWPMSGMKSWFGVDTPDHSLIPLWSPFAVYGVFFTFGWFLHRQPDLFTNFKKHWRQNLLITTLLLAGLMVFFLNLVYSMAAQPKGPAPDPAVMTNMLVMYNSVYAIASMTAVFAFIGVILHYFSHPGKRIRYLSDSAYWLYIAHLPVVVFFQILVAPLQIHWLLKMPLIFVPSFAILFLSYHYGVRNTWLGVLLNGRRYPLK